MSAQGREWVIESCTKYPILQLPSNGTIRPPKIFKNESVLDGSSCISRDGLFISLVTGEGFSKNTLCEIMKQCRDKEAIVPLFLRRRIDLLPKSLSSLEDECFVSEGGNKVDETQSMTVQGSVTPFEEKEEFGLCLGDEVLLKWSRVDDCEGLINTTFAESSGVPSFQILELSKLVLFMIETDDPSLNAEARFSATGTDVGMIPEEEVDVSQELGDVKYQQIPPEVPLGNPEDFKCSVCGKTENVWVHIYDGFIGCGRYNYGVENSGCTPVGEASWRQGAAVVHFEELQKRYKVENKILANEVSKFAVKINTVHRLGGTLIGDVYDYAADRMVSDPYLELHLATLGIQIDKLKKTGLRLTELQVQLNRQFDWSDADCSLDGRLVAGGTGLVNLGSTCYMSSILQVLARLTSFTDMMEQHMRDMVDFSQGTLFVDYFTNRSHKRFHQDGMVQLRRLIRILNGTDTNFTKEHDAFLEMKRDIVLEMGLEPGKGLLSRYKAEEVSALTPWLFRQLWFGNHPDYGTSRQQDVTDFLMAMFELLTKESSHFESLFQWDIIEVTKCLRTNQVKVKNDNEPVFYVSMSDVKDGDLSVQRLLHHYLMDGSTFEMQSFVDKQPGLGKTSYRLKETVAPPVLAITLQRFTYDDFYRPIKDTRSVHFDRTLNMTPYFTHQPIQPDETEFIDTSPPETVTFHCPHMANLREFGLSAHTIEVGWRTLYNKLSPNEKQTPEAMIDLNTLMDFIFQHPEFSDTPLPQTDQKGPESNSIVDEMKVLQLIEMFQTTRFDAEVMAFYLDTLGMQDMDFDLLFDFVSNEVLKEQMSLAYEKAKTTKKQISPKDHNKVKREQLKNRQGGNIFRSITPITKSNGVTYDLKYIIAHSGQQLNGGHYLVYMPHTTDTNWTAFNDSRIVFCTDPDKARENVQRDGYLAVYERVD